MDVLSENFELSHILIVSLVKVINIRTMRFNDVLGFCVLLEPFVSDSDGLDELGEM